MVRKLRELGVTPQQLWDYKHNNPKVTRRIFLRFLFKHNLYNKFYSTISFENVKHNVNFYEMTLHAMSMYNYVVYSLLYKSWKTMLDDEILKFIIRHETLKKIRKEIEA